MKLYRIMPSEVFKTYVLEDEDLDVLDVVDEFEAIEKLRDKWKDKILEQASGGVLPNIAFCAFPNALLIRDKYLSMFEKYLENENVEFIPLSDRKNLWYILHCCELADASHNTETGLLGNTYFIDKAEFVAKGYDEKKVFKLLRKGVVDIIEEELYTEKMVEFINSFDKVGVVFEEAADIRD